MDLATACLMVRATNITRRAELQKQRKQLLSLETNDTAEAMELTCTLASINAQIKALG